MLEYMIDASICMYPLTLCSIVALAVILDRWRVFKVAEADTPRLREEVIALLGEHRVDDAVDACKTSHGPVAAVLLVGLDRFRRLLGLGRSIPEIEANVTKAMDEFAPHVIGPLEKRVGILSMIATVAPLLGMTGTVTGMITSFTGMSEAGGLEGNMVAAGVSEALVNTAFGLFIAIPAAVFHHVYIRRLDHFSLDIARTGTQLIDFISIEHAAAVQAATARAEGRG
jgi:biopolymer transport protein ExbB